MHPRQLPCWITHTNARTHDIIRAGLDRSPMFTGVIKGVGPRYCPSIEDKVVRFAAARQPPDLPRARRASTRTRSIRTASRRRCRSTCSWRSCARCGAARTRTSCGPATPSSTTTSIRAALQADARDQGDRRPVLRRPDQRHHRLRGSRGAGPARRAQRARCWRAARTAGARAATRPTSACWSTTSSRAASPSRTGCSRRAPSTGCSCARTTPTCA